MPIKKPMRKQINRRQFLKRSTGVAMVGLGFPAIVPSSVFARSGAVLPSEKLTVGCVGMGGMGIGDMRTFMNEPDAHVVAVCDVDASHMARAKQLVDERYGNKDCATYVDFRDLVARDDIDIVQVTTPDHWHAVIAVAAAKAGKDIYGEKPIAHSLREGRAICDAVERYGRVWQTGSWQRARPNFRHACELVLNGRIGRVRHIEVGLPQGFSVGGDEGDVVTEPPPELDYEMWLGPAPWADYVPARVHWNWRWNLEYGGGQLMDWVGHHVDIAHWGTGMDTTGPVEIDGVGEYPPTGLWNAAPVYRVNTRYANGITMTIAGGHADIRSGTKWIGDDGWVWVDRGGIDAHPASLLRDVFSPNEIHLPRAESSGNSEGHTRNFLDGVKTRAATLAPAEVAHRSATPGHLGQIAMLLGRKIRFNPETEEILDDPTASRMLGNAMRSPWHV
jgi:predicted dehydrogenase